MMKKQRKPKIKTLFEIHHFNGKGTMVNLILFFLLVWKKNHQNHLIEIHKKNSDSSNTKKSHIIKIKKKYCSSQHHDKY